MTIHFLFASSGRFSPRRGFPPPLTPPPPPVLTPPWPEADPPFSRPFSPAVPTEPPPPDDELESLSRDDPRDFFFPRQQLRKQRKLDEDFLRLDSGRNANVSILGGTIVCCDISTRVLFLYGRKTIHRTIVLIKCIASQVTSFSRTLNSFFSRKPLLLSSLVRCMGTDFDTRFFKA